ncbi:polyketide antibiotic transporter [Rhodococcus sp. HNM0563]|uniref:ABC transporter permease n=1 Tax=Rhodococcus sp. HNM0563 TaxID=2716339 RepID=UPI00146E27A4|nr:polyketide antibiotic transporter [Rhodococcus sp. HNM0563]NLU64416.1 polyketide antibiotic transporter [Rhodococcus sp. HNM0563]
MTAVLASGADIDARSAHRFSGIGDLLRLYLRLDRVRIAVWTLALAFTVYVTVESLIAAYPDEAARQARAALLENPAAVLMTGPAYGADNYTLGAMTANELSLTLIVAVAIMNILLVVRHTRAEEEAGRLELLRALPVGPFAPPAAALLAVAVADSIVGAGVTLALLAGGLPVTGSVLFGVATAVTGLLFGAVAAVTAQFSEHSRTASGTALAVLAVAFLVRGFGDILEPTGSWVSWLSPIAWAQQTRLYVDERWWPLLLSVVAIGALLVFAVALSRRRDIGAGLRAPKPGPAEASASLLTPPGPAWRLLRGTFVAWTAALALLGLAMGTLADSIQDMVDSVPDIGEFLGGDTQSLTASFGATMLLFLVVGIAAFAVSAVMRIHADEDAGRIGLVIVTGTPRTRSFLWIVAVIVAQVVVASVVTGAATGLGMSIATGEADWIIRMCGAALAYAPAVLFVFSVSLALVGLVPRLANLAWVLVVYAVFVAWFGELLNLSQWLRDLSPFSHIPLVPYESASVAPMLILGAATVVLVAAAVVGFRRRDVTV